MNDQATANDTGNDYPPMTVLPIADDPTRVYVLGHSGSWLEVRFATDSQPAACECEDHVFRRRACKHIRRAEAFRDLGGVEQAREEISEWAQMTEAERREVFA